MSRPLKVFLSYAHDDEADGGWKSLASTMLRSLAQDGIIELFDDGMLDVTTDWDDGIREKLQSADLAIFLVSPSFNASPYISTIEVALACDRRDRGEMLIMPIIVRDCDWQYKRWAKVDAQPKTAGSVKPLEDWERPHQALGEISRKIRELHRTWATRPATPQPHADLGPPYRGLAMFERQHVDDFFGRERLVDQVWERLRVHPVVLLTGPSGSGKSSLIRAGIEPRVYSEGDWSISRFTPGNRPMVEWAKSLVSIIEPMTPRLDIPERARVIAERLIADPERLIEHVHSHQEATGKKLFFFIDQLEESFSLAKIEAPEQHQALVRTLAMMAESPKDVPFRAILGFRSDFLTALIEDDPEFVDAIQGCEIKARRMTPEELTRAIIAPAARRGVEIDVAVAAKIIADIEANPDALPLVGVALHELWRKRKGDRIHYEELDAIGGVAGALAKQADQALADSGVDEQDARRLLLALAHIDSANGVASHATRRPRRRSELGEELWQVAEKLGASRLITIDSGLPGDPVIDITHESLFRRWPRLRDWVDIHTSDIVFLQKIEARRIDWLEHECHDDFVWPASNIEPALDLMTRDMLTTEQRRFIESSTTVHSARAADVACTSHWLSLELNWFGGRPDIHELATLRTLTAAPAAHRAAMLRAALSNTDRSRKFQREPAVLLRVLGGLHSEGVLELLDILDAQVTVTNDVRCLAKSRMVMARWSAPIDGRMIEPAMTMVQTLIQQSDTAANLAASATALDGLAGHGPAEEIAKLATRVIEGRIGHYLDGNGSHLIGSLGPATAKLARLIDTVDADRLARRAIDGFGRTPALPASDLVVPVIRALCRRLSPALAESFASRLISAVSRSASPTRLNSIVEIADGLVDAMSEEAAEHALARLKPLLDRSQDMAQQLAIARLLVSFSRQTAFPDLDAQAAAVLATALTSLRLTRDPEELCILARTVTIFEKDLEQAASREFAHAIVQRSMAVAGRIDFLPSQRAAAEAIRVVANMIEPELAAETADQINTFLHASVSPLGINAWSRTLGSLLERAGSADMAPQIAMIRRNLGEGGNVDALAALCHTIDAIAKNHCSPELVDLLDHVSERLLRTALEAGDTTTLATATRGLCRIARHLDRQVFLHAALLILRHPLSGDEGVTALLVNTIANALPLSFEPDSSHYQRFWQVMGALEKQPGLESTLRSGLPTAQSVEAAIAVFRRQRGRQSAKKTEESQPADPWIE
ncbi:MAG: toll/interleukin-1 receptor domain-containing protein [Geminicoccaceae bacterium]